MTDSRISRSCRFRYMAKCTEGRPNISQVTDTSAEATRLHQLLLQGYQPHAISGAQHKEKKKAFVFSLPEKFISTVRNCFETGVRVSLIKNPPCWCGERAIFYTKKKKPWAFEDRANLQARRENQPGDDIPPCWR